MHGVALSTLSGENSILNRTSEANKISGVAQITEELQLAINALGIDYFTNSNLGTFRNYIFSEDTGKGQEKLKVELGADNISFDTTNYQITYKAIIFDVLEEGTLIANSGETIPKPNPLTGGITGAELAALTANGMKELTEEEILNSNMKDNNNLRAVLTGQIPIPAGYTYVEGTATTEETAPNSWGVVIKDSNQNEWVWVPVNATESIAPSRMYDTISPKWIAVASNKKTNLVKRLNEIKIASTAGLNGLRIASSDSSSEDRTSSSENEQEIVNKTTDKKSASEIINGILRGNPDNTAYFREPALIIDDDLDPQNYKRAGNFASAQEFANAIVEDYNNMIDSILKYGGFYVGRYELCGIKEGLEPICNLKIQRDEIPLGTIDWYEAYKSNRAFETTTTTSTMIWGSQWDVLCLWISKVGDKVPYDSTDQSYDDWDYPNKSGSNESDKRNNVYDLKGNKAEWTQEAYSTTSRAIRGGEKDYIVSIAFRDAQDPNYLWYNLNGTRTTLYIK